jgi:hypothetical protein
MRMLRPFVIKNKFFRPQNYAEPGVGVAGKTSNLRLR